MKLWSGSLLTGEYTDESWLPFHVLEEGILQCTHILLIQPCLISIHPPSFQALLFFLSDLTLQSLVSQIFLMPFLNQLAIVSRSQLSTSRCFSQCCSRGISLSPGLAPLFSTPYLHILVSCQICLPFYFLFLHPAPPPLGDFVLGTEKSPIHFF